jgi:hypothetical protein
MRPSLGGKSFWRVMGRRQRAENGEWLEGSGTTRKQEAGNRKK